MKRSLLFAFSLLTSLCAMAQKDVISREDTLREVTVTSRSAEKRINEVQIGVEKVEIATLARVPALFGEKDIIKSIQLLPGVKSEGEGSGGYQVRGGTAAQNLILLDGATIYNSGHLMGLFSTFNDDGTIRDSIILSHEDGRYGVDIPKNVWHTLECIESATIFEVKEGPFVPHEEEGILDVKG